jgi:hypothetical protein
LTAVFGDAGAATGNWMRTIPPNVISRHVSAIFLEACRRTMTTSLILLTVITSSSRSGFIKQIQNQAATYAESVI